MSSLARLLIISAIDLLFCCFTMGVMLFLVLEPSQRPDQNSAFSRTSASVGAAGAATAGSQASPVIVAVWNKSDNPLKPVGIPPDFQRVPKDPKSQTPDKIVLTATAADIMPPLHFRSDEFGSATTAKIFVGAQDKLIEREASCNGGVDVVLNLEQPEPITLTCGTVVTVCSVDVSTNGTFDIAAKDLRPDQFLLLVVPHDHHPEVGFNDSKRCLISPTFDATRNKSIFDPAVGSALYELARDCGLQDQNRVQLLRADEDTSECVRTKLLSVGKLNWKGECVDTPFTANHDRAYFLATTGRQPPATNDCQRALVKEATQP